MKAKKAEFALNSLIRTTVGHLQPTLSLKMFDTQISPILEYSSEVWFNNKEIETLEKIHIGYMKRILKVKTSTSTIPLYAEFGRFSIAQKMKLRVINYWKRIMSLEQSNLVRQAYHSLMELNRLNQPNWCTVVQDILKEANLENCWDNQTIEKESIQKIKIMIHQNFMSNCIREIQNSEKNPKLRTYKLFKTEFKLENYLIMSNNYNHTVSLARLRISSHNLAIETGRYTKPKTPIIDRKCIHCSMNEVETEQHFLLSCPLYNEERKGLLETSKQILTNLEHENDDDKFIKIMSSHEPTLLKVLSKFISVCMDKRSKITVN